MMNFTQLFEVKSIAGKLKRNHPKFPAFLRAVMQSGIGEGTVIEMRVTLPDSREYVTNVKLCEEDIECIRRLVEMQKNSGK